MNTYNERYASAEKWHSYDWLNRWCAFCLNHLTLKNSNDLSPVGPVILEQADYAFALVFNDQVVEPR